MHERRKSECVRMKNYETMTAALSRGNAHEGALNVSVSSSVVDEHFIYLYLGQ